MKKFLFVDMDGTLAAWKPATPEELTRPHYFARLPVNGNVVQALQFIRDEHNDQDVEIYILSAVLQETKAETDKKTWLSVHCPYINSDHQVFVPYGKNKAEYVKQLLKVDMKECYLLDDYSKNIKEWAAAGGVPIKMFNGINGKSLRYSGAYTCAWLSPEQMYKDIAAIMRILPDEDLLAGVEQLLDENEPNFDKTSHGFDEGYASGYHDALVDVLRRFGWVGIAEEIGYID